MSGVKVSLAMTHDMDEDKKNGDSKSTHHFFVLNITIVYLKTLVSYSTSYDDASGRASHAHLQGSRMNNSRDNPRQSHQDTQDTPIAHRSPAHNPTKCNNRAGLQMAHNSAGNRTRTVYYEELRDVDGTSAHPTLPHLLVHQPRP